MEIVTSLGSTEINARITRIYDEMEEDENTISKINLNKEDQVRRLKEYYYKLEAIGEFKDLETGRIKIRSEIAKTILTELHIRHFSLVSRRHVYTCLPEDCKRAWRKPVTNDGKVLNSTLPDEDQEVLTIFHEMQDAIQLIHNFDYNELPKNLREEIGEKVYKLYRSHEKQWTKHGMIYVKYDDGFHITDKFEDIIRINEGQPYEGELYETLVMYYKTFKEMTKKYKNSVLDSEGNRKVTLEDEHIISNGLRSFLGFLVPHKNRKWKREIYGWARILKRKWELKGSESGAAKFSRKRIIIESEDVDEYRGITKEEIAKNEKRLIKYFMQFMETFPPAIALISMFEIFEEPMRAAHSINMHEKLSHNA